MIVLVQYLRIFAVAYEKTLELCKELRAVGCGDLDVEGFCCFSSSIVIALYDMVEVVLCCIFLYMDVHNVDILFSCTCGCHMLPLWVPGRVHLVFSWNE